MLLRDAEQQKIFPRVIVWTLLDRRRVTPVPPGHWLLVEDSTPFRATLKIRNPESETPKPGGPCSIHRRGQPARRLFSAARNRGGRRLDFGTLRHGFAKSFGDHPFSAARTSCLAPNPQASDLVLLTNGIGGMARLCVDLGRVNSKYDCVLGANLNPGVPVDRHVLVKRLRAWVNADGFLSPLDAKNLASFAAGPPAVWQFVANAGDGRTVEIELRAEMPEGKNTTVFQFSRPTAERADGKQLPADADVRLTVRFDIEDRNFHWETKRNGGADHHFSTNTHEIRNGIGFAFTPAPDRQLRVFANSGQYYPQPEWCENIPHPVEQSRGQTGSGDAYSPGWFEFPLPKGANAMLVATAETAGSSPSEFPTFDLKLEMRGNRRRFRQPTCCAPPGNSSSGAAKAKPSSPVIRGFWIGAATRFIACRGLLAAGMVDEVKQILLTFAKFEKDGTLPNTVHGEDVSNRDTSDAPLWFALVCEELGRTNGTILSTSRWIQQNGRTVRDVLASIAENYVARHANGIRMDADSALIWSPAHFTWMDTNFPAGTPREGYPVEIQALWIRLLRQLEKISAGREAEQQKMARPGRRARRLRWKNFSGSRNTAGYADLLIAKTGQSAAAGTADDALRSNYLFAVSLGLVTGERAKRCVEAAQKYLVVPGALRSLAPLPVSVPLPIYRDGQLLNNPAEPYWPRYEGDEDTRRKPAYHNGTAWTWTFPTFCEALARAWDFAPEAVAAAKAYLGSMEQLMNEGCLGQIPEILDGDAPHTQRGCDAQAWGVTEALRVWKWLNSQDTQAK